MKGKKNVFTAVIICCCAIILILLIISLVGFNEKTAEVHFAGSNEGSVPVDNDEGAGLEGDGLVYISLDESNFAFALETLDKPESYSSEYSVESFWLGGSESCQVSAFVRGEVVHVSAAFSSFTKDVVLTEDNYYIWYSDDSALIKGDRGDALRTKEIEDAVLMSGSYKELSSLPPENIIKAEYAPFGSEYCIHISTYEGSLGYRYEYYISLDTGLLLSNEVYDGETIVYRMTLKGAKLSAPEDYSFILPNGEFAE